MIITPSRLHGDITAPPSKSMAHRSIIAAALAEGLSFISNIELSDDIMSTIEAVKLLGAKVTLSVDENERIQLAIQGIAGESKERMPHINCRESGSTLRFMIPIVLASAGGGIFDGEELLPKRPIDSYEKIFTAQGINWHCQSEKDNLPLKIEGTMKSGEYALPGNISSQYITGLLFALPLLDGDSQITIQGNLESASYVDMTIQMLAHFGIQIDKNEDTYIIKGNQQYKQSRYRVEGDWSQAAFLIIAGILGDGTKVHGLDAHSKQGDKAIMDIAQKMGADIKTIDGVVHASKSKLIACDVDVSQCPDLAPAIAAAMSVADGKSTIFGGQRLKVKESDRIMSVTNALNNLGAKVTPTDDGMVIVGKKTLSGTQTDAPADHRIAMMVAAVSQMCNGQFILTGADSVNKSYPSFWDEFVALGGKIS
ncbi:MAG: 3-phosphoshikimate 1-carboxyvinyltransferase [Clostridiales bacterium]|nr:3-phosphoshikimate 1-carboxyvinyltransferase [Clostridiales bacterium]